MEKRKYPYTRGDSREIINNGQYWPVLHWSPLLSPVTVVQSVEWPSINYVMLKGVREIEGYDSAENIKGFQIQVKTVLLVERRFGVAAENVTINYLTTIVLG